MKTVIENTSEYRGSTKSVSQYKEVTDLLKINNSMKAYGKFLDAVDVYEKIRDIFKEK